MKIVFKILIGLIFFSLFFYCHQRSLEKEIPLYVHPDHFDFSQNPQLLQRIVSTPHGYYRFINVQFAGLVCERLKEMKLPAHALNLHGDAHLEQYAVTDIGRGLTDFDDASSGPGLIDWMRFSTSLYLACYQKEWTEHYETLFQTFFRGYRDALNDSAVEVPEPVIVQRLKNCFITDRKVYFQWIDTLIDPLSRGEQDSLLKAFDEYVVTMLNENPSLPDSFFKVVKIGYLRMGIGSALDVKYLLRIRGPGPDPLDDEILEIKQVRDLDPISCINPGSKFDPFRIMIAQARIAYEPFQYLGYFRYCQKTFWVHGWVDNYQQVDIETTFHTVDELAQVVYDIGVQLGMGHTNQIAAPFDEQLRQKLKRVIDQYDRDIFQLSVDLAKLSLDAHSRFCRTVD
ncbi:DUF2252 domain-containing protein [candidate division KSB1 bacterium]|nr:DUF2252 domain-containing protein [candidate division KSB1 bacterium]